MNVGNSGSIIGQYFCIEHHFGTTNVLKTLATFMNNVDKTELVRQL